MHPSRPPSMPQTRQLSSVRQALLSPQYANGVPSASLCGAAELPPPHAACRALGARTATPRRATNDPRCRPPRAPVRAASRQVASPRAACGLGRQASGRVPQRLLRSPPVAGGCFIYFLAVWLAGLGTSQGSACQICLAYSSMVRSVENLPLPAVAMMDMRVHLAGSRYVSSTLVCTATAPQQCGSAAHSSPQ